MSWIEGRVYWREVGHGVLALVVLPVCILLLPLQALGRWYIRASGG